MMKDIKSDRYKLIGKYKVDRWITQGCMLFIFLYLFFVAYQHDFSMDYLVCSNPILEERNLTNYVTFVFNLTSSNSHKASEDHSMECKNPFYKPISWKNSEYLPPGEYGTKPKLSFNIAWLVVFIVFVIGFGINHLIYNRGFKYERNKNISNN